MTLAENTGERAGASVAAQDWLDGPLSTTLANLSHELKTPLNAILGQAQLLSRERSLSEKGQTRVEAILRSGEHLLSLVNAFLDASAARAGELQINLSPSSTVALIGDVVSMFGGDARRKGIELSCRLASDTPSHVLADNGKIRQILINLVGNAVKYTETGGVHVLARATDLSEDSCTLQIEVMDTGPGIGPDEQLHVFERYARGPHRAGVEGVGLGLAISQHNARLLGGSLSVESRVGKGSVFRLSVPVTWLHYDATTIDPFDVPESSGRFALSRGMSAPLKQPVKAEQRIPAPLAEAFLAAARAGDADEVALLTEQLPERDLANRLRVLALNFDYEGVTQLVGALVEHSGTDAWG